MKSLERSILEPGRYNYLDEKDSKLYDDIKDSKDKKDIIIKRLILEKANSCLNRHRNSTYKIG